MEGTESSFAAVAAFVMSYGLLVMLPGPNMAVAVRAGLTMSHADRTKTVVGIALGASALVTIATLPTIVFSSSGEAGRFFAAGAGLVLIGLGLRMLLTPRMTPLAASPAGSRFGIAFITALSNPTTALYFASSSVSVSHLSSGPRVVLMATVVFTVAGIWFSLVSWMLSNDPFRFHSSRYMREIDIVAALLLMGFGIFTMLGPD